MKFFIFIKNLIRDAIQKYYVTSFFVVGFFVFSSLAVRNGFYMDLFFDLDNEVTVKLALIFMFSAVSSLVIYRIDGMMNGRLGNLGIIGISFVTLALWGTYFLNISLTGDISGLISRWSVICFVQLVMFFSVPYYKREGLGRHLWNVVGIIAQAFIFSFALMLGLFFIAFTLNSLFELREYRFFINEYDMLALFSFALAFPHFCLSLYAREDAAEHGEERLNIRGELDFVSRVLLYYILMPLLIVYTVVLYLYFAKIALGGVFPDNIMANLVVWYLFASHVAMYFISSIGIYKNEFERWMVENSRKYIPALILPTIVMFISIFIRVSAYGFTEGRYLLLAFAVFNTFGLMLLFFYRSRAQFTIVLCAVCTLVIAFFGEFSQYSVAYRSQMAKLEEKLASAGYPYDKLQSGEISVSDIEAPIETIRDMQTSIWVIQRNLPEGVDTAVLDKLSQRFYTYHMIYDSYGSEEYQIIQNYYYDAVHIIAEDELFFELSAGMSKVLDNGFFVTAVAKGIHVFDSESYTNRKELYFSPIVSNVARDKGEKTVYSDSFEFEGSDYQITIVLQDFSFKVDNDGNPIYDGSYYGNYYVAIILKKVK